MDEIDAPDAVLFQLQPAPSIAECSEDMLQQQEITQDVAAGEVPAPAKLKADDMTCATPSDQQMKVAANAVEPVMKPSAVKASVPSSLLRRLLRYSLPLPLLFVILFGSLYLLCDHWNEMLNDLGLIISPQLRHVRGAPPV